MYREVYISMWQDYFIKIINAHLEASKKRNRYYSLRSFSKKCQISPGTLSDILSKKNKISRKIALRIIPNLDIDQIEKIQLMNLVKDSSGNSKRVQLTEKQNHLIENWHAFAILYLFELKDKPQTNLDISNRLNLPIDTVKSVIDDLIHLKLLIVKDGQLYSSGKRLASSDEISSDSIKRSHRNGLQTALKALDEIPIELRDFTSVVFAVNPDKLKRFKMDLRNFFEKSIGYMSRGELKSVYKINVQVFPLDYR